MKINEIERVTDQNFPIDVVKYYLSISSPKGMLDNKFLINYLEQGNTRGIILTDEERNVAAYAGFDVRINGKIWQARNAQTYAPYIGQALVARIYKLVKETYKKSIQSDTEQSDAGMKLWSKTLPGLGMKPMIFDTKTERIINPENFDLSLMYPEVADTDPIQWRYTWILERFDHYPSQNLMNEDSLLMPYTGLWYNPNKGKSC